MDTDYDRIKQQIILHILDGISPEEERELEAWRREKPEHEIFFRKVTDEERLSGKLAGYEKTDIGKALSVNQMMLRERVKRRIIIRTARYAAVLAALAAIWILISDRHDINHESDIIAAGMKRAELILEDGTNFLLDERVEREIVDNEVVVRVSGEGLSYENAASQGATEYHTVRTPRGGEYMITLSDGTRVWLNAMSELRYPGYFGGGVRGVELKGEGYFEVAESEVPFVVAVSDCRVTVLGTRFNITAYHSEPEILTTLCSGSVTIGDTSRSAPERVIEPGEQLIFNRNTHDMEIRRVDTDIHTDWLKGKFRFENNTVEEVFNVLSRWYDIEVVYSGDNVKWEVFTGILPRFCDLQTILGVMEKVSDVKFEVRGHTVLIQ